MPTDTRYEFCANWSTGVELHKQQRSIFYRHLVIVSSGFTLWIMVNFAVGVVSVLYSVRTASFILARNYTHLYADELTSCTIDTRVTRRCRLRQSLDVDDSWRHLTAGLRTPITPPRFGVCILPADGACGVTAANGSELLANAARVSWHHI